jgi:hypothetical protein
MCAVFIFRSIITVAAIGAAIETCVLRSAYLAAEEQSSSI